MNDPSTPTAIVIGVLVFIMILGMLILKYYFDKNKL